MVRRIDVVIVVEAQVIRVVAIVVAVRRRRPTVAVASDKAQTATVVEAITRSRIPDGTCGTKLAGEVHALVGTVICLSKR